MLSDVAFVTSQFNSFSSPNRLYEYVRVKALIAGAPLLLDEDPDELEEELLEEEEELELDDELLDEELEEPLLLPPSPPPQPANKRQTTSAAHTERREGSMVHPFWRRHFTHRNLTLRRGLVLQITQGCSG